MWPRLWLLLVGSVSFCTVSVAQTPSAPDAGRVLQESAPRPAAPAPQPDLPAIKAPTPAPKPQAAESDSRILVQDVHFTGNEVFNQETLRSFVAEAIGKRLNFGELIQLIEKVELRYKEAGYFLAQAYLPPQKIKDGTIEIAVTEGRLGEARIEGDSNIDSMVVFAYLDKLPKGKALTLPPLERQVLLINDLAGSNAKLALEAGAEAGTTDVVIAQKVDPALSGRLDVSNHGSAATGEKRIGLNVIVNSPTGQGDRLTASVMTTDTVNLRSYNLSYDLPLGGDGWRLAATISRAEYDLGGAFKALKGGGTADSMRLGIGYPIIRSRATNLRVQLEADRSKLNDQIKAIGTDVNKGSRGLTGTIGFDTTDGWGGGGSSRAEFKVKSGIIDLGPGSTTPEVAGVFNKTSITLSRQQTLGKTLAASAQLSHQLASKNLDSSEKLSAGGPSTMPGYANGAGSGDIGNLLRLNLRWQASPTLALSAMANQAHLRQSHTSTANTSNYKFLRDYGLSADWLIAKGVSLNALLAWADVIDGSTPVVAGSDYFRPRTWFSLGWAF